MTDRRPDTSTPDAAPSIPGKPTRRPRRAKAPVLRLAGAIPQPLNRSQQAVVELLRQMLARATRGEIESVLVGYEESRTGAEGHFIACESVKRDKIAKMMLRIAVLEAFPDEK